jgi:hypothetical protein
MNQNINQQNNPVDFGNDWGFYVDIENPHSPNNKNNPFRDKYNKSYNNNNKIDEEVEYYEYKYNKKMEEYEKQEERNSIKKSLSLLFNISSTTLITAAISYCLFCAL